LVLVIGKVGAAVPAQKEGIGANVGVIVLVTVIMPVWEAGVEQPPTEVTT
jgi:hypothetical protein